MRIPAIGKSIASLLTILNSMCTAAFAANAIWSGAVSDDWSGAANWSGATPAGNAVIFNDTDATGGGAYGAANNIVDANITVQSLRYGNTNGYHNTSIPAGVTLRVDSATSPIMYVGTGADNGAVQTVYASLQGPGSLLVTNTSGIISIIQGSASSGAKNATLDMESLNSFTAYVSQIRVAAENGGSSTPQYNRPGATLILAKTNFIYASGNPGLRVSWSSGNGGPGIVKLGATNAIFSNSGMNIGDRKSASTTKLEFNPMFPYPTPFALFRDQAGTGRQNQWIIGDQVLQTSGSTSAAGTIDFSSGIVDALVGTIIVGRGAGTGATGTGTGTLTLGPGTIDANDVNIGVQSAGAGIGTVNVGASYFDGPGTLRVNNTLRLTTAAGGEATLTVTGGNIYANNIESGGGAKSDIALTGAILAVTNSMGTLTLPVMNLNLSDSTILLPVRSGATNLFVTYLTVGGTSNNVLGITALPPITAYPYQATLISYLSYLSSPGTEFVARFPGLAPSYTGYISNNVAQSTLDLVITGGPAPARDLVWKGSINGNWDTTTANWGHGVTSTTFNNGDAVEFNELGVNTTISLIGPITPSRTILVSAAKAYAFGGVGFLTGDAALLKTGTGMLTISNSANNTFSGVVGLSNGVLRVSGSDNRLPTNTFLTLGDAPGIAFQLGGVNQELNSLSGGGPGSLVSLGTSTLTLNGAGTFYGVIEGSGSLVKSGTSAQVLLGASTYSGGTRVTGGSLVIANPTGSGTGSGFVQVETNATLTIGAGDASGIIATSTITNNGTVVLSRNDSFTLSNVIVGDGGLTKNNTTGQVSISAANDYKGPTTINSGTLRLSHAAGLGTTDAGTSIGNDPTARLELAGGVTVPEYIILSQKQSAAGYAPGLVNYSGTNTLAGPMTLNPGGSFWIVAADAGKLIINGSITNNTTSGNRLLWLSGAATGEWNSGLRNGTGTSNTGLRKDDEGTWILSGLFDYPNTTVVSNGTLLVNGQIQGGSVHVYGGTLGGVGTISVPLTVYPGANLAPGASIGKLTINNGVWLQGNTIMEVSGAGHDQVAVSGTLTNGGTLTVLLSGAVYGGEVFQVFTAGQFVGDFIQVDLPVLPAGMSWNTEALNTAGVLSISGGAPKINVSRNGSNLTFSWAGSGYRLLAQTNSLAIGLSDTWGPYPGGEASPVSVTIDPAKPTVFFRLVSP